MAKLQSRLSVAPPHRHLLADYRVNRIAAAAVKHGFLNSVLRVTFLYRRTRNFGGGRGLFHVILRREGNDAI